jgi:hypothetical protein
MVGNRPQVDDVQRVARLRDADDDRAGQRHRHPGAQPPREPLAQQPAAEQRDQDRPDGDDHRGGARVHLALAGWPPTEREGARNRLPGRQAMTSAKAQVIRRKYIFIRMLLCREFAHTEIFAPCVI